MEAKRTPIKVNNRIPLRDMLIFRCPRCSRGSLFVSRNPYSFWNGMHMAEQCGACGQDFRVEPGFYLGTLWAGFPIVILLTAALSALFSKMLCLRLTPSFLLTSFTLLAIQPLVNRVGRAIWIALYVNYQEELHS